MPNQPREDLKVNELEMTFQAGMEARLESYSQEVERFWAGKPRLLEQAVPLPREEEAVRTAEEKLRELEANPGSSPQQIAAANARLVSAKRELKRRQSGTKPYVEEMFGVVRERMQRQSLLDRCTVEGKDATVFEHFSEAQLLAEALEAAIKQRDRFDIEAKRKGLENYLGHFNKGQIQGGCRLPREVNPFQEGPYELDKQAETVLSESGVNLRTRFGIWQMDAFEVWDRALTLEGELEALAAAEDTRGETHERVRHVTSSGRVKV